MTRLKEGYTICNGSKLNCIILQHNYDENLCVPHEWNVDIPESELTGEVRECPPN